MKKEKDLRKGIFKEIELPDNASATIDGQCLLIKGPKGEVSRTLNQQSVKIKLDNKKILLESGRDTKRDKKLVGSLAAHIKNMIKGSLQTHIYTLKICSGHFPMNVSVSGNKLIIKNFFGEKVPRMLQLKDGANVKVEGELIHVAATSKEIAGQVSADIEQLTRRPGYDTRIFQDGCYIISKDGKELK